MSEPASTAVCSREAVRQAWVERLQRFAASGLSAVRFCAQEGLSPPTFYSWKRRLAAEQDATGDAPRLLPVRVHSAAPVEPVLPTGAVLRLVPGCGRPQGSSHPTLTAEALVAALEAVVALAPGQPGPQADDALHVGRPED